ncbi:hypothetical protein Cgig2_024912 [Carnegiea gigantea]|uniref:DUF4283 domain-containing protein n=1 Tax=Carnegiea gigantea TaxID=171969 RepID=A0A9Q1KE53_9CARY|nr:hypothetical protein Cgig2_024912 [Carnegiea gigantea]
MESAIHDALAKLKLTVEEEEILEFEEDVDEEKADQIAPSLIGKLHTVNSFNIGAIKATFKKVWKPARGLVIKKLNQNLFLFQFFSNADKVAMMNEGPWAFNNHTLLLKELTGMEKYSDVVFDTTRDCEAFDDSIPEDKLPYGANMRVSPIASKRGGQR